MDPFGSLGTGTLPHFLSAPMATIRQFIGLLLLIVAGIIMAKSYFAGHHKRVYAAIAVLGLIEWVLFSPETLFNIMNVIFNWVYTHWINGS